ncbi:M20/M25/M40 family metallo-hydrolase [Candidatus Peregrinibacteria bacterium]|nr:M20/M25/M40 family metallo-hydrolase [Candidatus Peregrinibacteria bacterium]
MDRHLLLSLLEQFIAFPTIAGREDAKRECLDWIETSFFSHAHARFMRGEMRGAPYLRSPSTFVHVDVVPAPADQFHLRMDGDRALGRGVKDMKGCALPFLIAFDELCRSGMIPPASILLTSDEEIGGATIPALFEQNILGNVPVACTPDGGDGHVIIVEHKGAAWARLTCAGKGGHGAYPWTCVNPIALLANALRILSTTFPPGTNADWRVTVSPTQLSAGIAMNAVPDAATCTLDIRFPPTVCATPSEALAIVARALPSGCTLTLLEQADPLQIDPAHPMLQRLKRILEEVTGVPIALTREHGATDTRHSVLPLRAGRRWIPFHGGVGVSRVIDGACGSLEATAQIIFLIFSHFVISNAPRHPRSTTVLNNHPRIGTSTRRRRTMKTPTLTKKSFPLDHFLL